MTARIVTVVTEQSGTVVTAGGASEFDSKSKPIEQRPVIISTTPPSQNIQQRLSLSTGSEVVDSELTSTSKPISQRPPAAFTQGGLGSIAEEGGIVEQRKTNRKTGENKDTPIEQRRFGTADIYEGGNKTTPVQQFILNRDATGDEPLEQVAKITNEAEINQFDFAELVFPPCNSIKNPVNTNILWRVRDAGFTFDINSIIFSIDGLEVQDRSEFTLDVLEGGLQLNYNPPSDFEFGTSIFIRLDIQDTADPPNRIVYNCVWFTVPDTKAPIISLASPTCDQGNIDTLAPVVFDILDRGAGVDLDSIVLSIEGINVCDGITFDAITTVTSGTGYRGTYSHPARPFRYQSNITVAINAADLSDNPNSSFFVCSFDVESSTEPKFINIAPPPCATFVDVLTGLRFEVYGDVDGVDISTLDVRVDNKLRKVTVQPRILRSE